MLVYALVPALVLLIGAIIITSAFVSAPSPTAEIHRRVNLVTGAPAVKKKGALAAAVEDQQKSRRNRLDQMVRGLFSIGKKYTWAMEAGAVKLLLVSAVFGVAGWWFTHRVVDFTWWVAVATGAFSAYFVPRALLNREQRRAEMKFMDLFPDAVDTIVRMLRAGLPMTAAVKTVGTDGTPPVSTIFSMVSDQIRIGITLEDALNNNSQRLGLEDFRFFAVAVLLQYSTGGNIASTLEMLAGIIRKRRAMRQKAKAATAEIRLTAYVLGSLPFLTIGFLLLVKPDYLMPLFIDPRGHGILGMAAGGLTLSFFTMRQMMRSVIKG
jgi:tight adherence protein B